LKRRGGFSAKTNRSAMHQFWLKQLPRVYQKSL
jgi:hypothetical protein